MVVDELLCRYRGCDAKADPRSLQAPPESEMSRGARASPLCSGHFDLIIWVARYPGLCRVHLAGAVGEVGLSVELLPHGT